MKGKLKTKIGIIRILSMTAVGITIIALATLLPLLTK